MTLAAKSPQRTKIMNMSPIHSVFLAWLFQRKKNSNPIMQTEKMFCNNLSDPSISVITSIIFDQSIKTVPVQWICTIYSLKRTSCCSSVLCAVCARVARITAFVPCFVVIARVRPVRSAQYSSNIMRKYSEESKMIAHFSGSHKPIELKSEADRKKTFFYENRFSNE